ncbi:MAG: MBL fold metallo-hydrolase [Candidatus Thorarchaeota archaeon]|jgi:L-ascorbate metabolism protein UlaG (beta-lactamase superfamily)
MGITIKWLAHASFEIKFADKTIYIDPSTNYTGLKDKDFEEADLIAVTHNHGDHCDAKLLKKIRKLGSAIVAPPKAKEAIGKAGVVWELQAGQFMDISGGIKVRAVEAYNVKRFRKENEPFHPQGLGVGFVLTLEGRRIYHAGDTDFIEPMNLMGDIDVALLPIDGHYTMDVEEATEAALAIEPAIAIPMHHREADPEVFKANVEGKSDYTKVVVLRPGEEYTLE